MDLDSNQEPAATDQPSGRVETIGSSSNNLDADMSPRMKFQIMIEAIRARRRERDQMCRNSTGDNNTTATDRPSGRVVTIGSSSNDVDADMSPRMKFRSMIEAIRARRRARDQMRRNSTGDNNSTTATDQPSSGRVETIGSSSNDVDADMSPRMKFRIKIEAIRARRRERDQTRGNPTGEGGKSCGCGKRDSSHLAAEPSGSGAHGFPECSICLEAARDPVLTCCGHLFCWPCFYRVPKVDSWASTKACPVCKGEVSDDTVTPVYVSGGGPAVTEYSSGLIRIPPRPKARRVESARQRMARGPLAGVLSYARDAETRLARLETLLSQIQAIRSEEVV
ncbi:hypothetical protein ACP275_14G167400 [Erythranthe tilingii]